MKNVRRFRPALSSVIAQAGVYLAVVISLVPLIWAFSTSLKLPKDFYLNPPVLLPSEPTAASYISLFTDFAAGSYFGNTIIIAVGNTVLMLALGIPAAYAVARYKSGGNWFVYWVLLQRMLPPVTILIPLWMVFRTLHLLDTYPGMILAYGVFNLPLAVWMLIGFFEEFPRDLQDQAMVDGCSELGAIIRVVLPVLSPALVALGLFLFIFAWNELMYAIVLSRVETRPIMILFYNLLQSPTGIFFGQASGSVLIGVVPAYVLALAFQRYLVRGIVGGALK
jgi:multiple sugar transport system permease protein